MFPTRFFQGRNCVGLTDRAVGILSRGDRGVVGRGQRSKGTETNLQGMATAMKGGMKGHELQCNELGVSKNRGTPKWMVL